MRANVQPSAAKPVAWRGILWCTVALLLLAPAIVMQFIQEVAWDATDFQVAAIILVGLGLVIELAMRATQRPVMRSVAITGAIMFAAIIWIDGAVGIF